LAGSGLRIAEALGLEIGKHLSDDCSIVLVRQQRSKKGRGIEPFPKTDAGFRDVGLDPALALLLKNYIGVLQTSEVRTLLIDYWMGHASGEMAGRYGKQLLDNVRWRQECAAKVGLGFMLPEDQSKPLLDKSGQVF
jgi:hypothetical protein